MGNSIALSSIFGALIEFNQASIPGRTADPLDWILDTLGALAFLLVLKKLQSSHT
jgi:VanZ family protein